MNPLSDIDLQPTLIGEKITLRPLAQEDFPALYKAASDPKIWEMHPDSTRYKRDVFEERFFLGALSCGGALVVVENETGKIIGSSRYYEWVPDDREISIGYTFLERSHWGKGTNTTTKALMLNYIFEWAELVWFHIGKTNLRSRAAVEKLGAVLSFEEERQLDTSTYFQLYYKLDASSYNSQLAENTFNSGI